jgi:hypothetical protein
MSGIRGLRGLPWGWPDGWGSAEVDEGMGAGAGAWAMIQFNQKPSFRLLVFDGFRG